MSNCPAPPPSDGYGQTATEPPPAIKTAVNIIWAVVALSVVGTVMTFVLLDDIVEATGANLTQAQEDAARTGGIVGAIIGFLVFGVLWIVLGIFLRKGASWARIVLTVLVGLGLIFGLLGLTQDQPAALLALTVIQIVLYAALLLFMWRRESSDYIAAQKRR